MASKSFSSLHPLGETTGAHRLRELGGRADDGLWDGDSLALPWAREPPRTELSVSLRYLSLSPSANTSSVSLCVSSSGLFSFRRFFIRLCFGIIFVSGHTGRIPSSHQTHIIYLILRYTSMAKLGFLFCLISLRREKQLRGEEERRQHRIGSRSAVLDATSAQPSFLFLFRCNPPSRANLSRLQQEHHNPFSLAHGTIANGCFTAVRRAALHYYNAGISESRPSIHTTLISIWMAFPLLSPTLEPRLMCGVASRAVHDTTRLTTRGNVTRKAQK